MKSKKPKHKTKPAELQARNAAAPGATKPIRKGPVPETLKLKDEDWQDNVDKALKVKRPPGGWPK